MLSPYTITLSCHSTPSLSTVAVYCYSILSLYIVILYLHALKHAPPPPPAPQRCFLAHYRSCMVAHRGFAGYLLLRCTAHSLCFPLRNIERKHPPHPPPPLHNSQWSTLIELACFTELIMPHASMAFVSAWLPPLTVVLPDFCCACAMGSGC